MEKKSLMISLKSGILLSLLIILLFAIIFFAGFYRLKNRNIPGRVNCFNKEDR